VVRATAWFDRHQIPVPLRFHALHVQAADDGRPVAFYLQWDLGRGDDPYPLDKIEGVFYVQFPGDPAPGRPVESPGLVCDSGASRTYVLLAAEGGG